MSGYECFNKKRFSSRRKVDSELATTTSVGSVFQMCGAATAKARLPTVDSLTGGTTRRLASVIRMRNHMRKLRQLLYSCLFRTLLRRLVPGANRVLTSASPLTNSMSPMSSIIRYVIDLMPDSGSITSISTLQYHMTVIFVN